MTVPIRGRNVFLIQNRIGKEDYLRFRNEARREELTVAGLTRKIVLNHNSPIASEIKDMRLDIDMCLAAIGELRETIRMGKEKTA